MKPTIKDVAREAGVSVSTVSMALNDRAGVSVRTKMHVRNIARALNYVPDYSARSLVMQDSNCIGLMIPEITNPFYSAIVDNMTRIAEEKGYTVILGISGSKSRHEAEYVKLFLSRRVKGVVIVPMLASRPDIAHLEMLRSANLPVVFCTERYQACEEPLVMCDFAQGQYDVTRFLIDKGLTDFRFVSTDMDVMFAHLRYEGFAKALREAGIPIDPKKIMLLQAPRFLDAYAATDRIVDDLPQAVVCINDIMTMGIIKRMVERGLSIPEDVSVVGFDDIMFSELMTPPLTTVRQPLWEICLKSVEILERKILACEEQDAVDKGKTYLVKPQLVVRKTTV